MTRSQQPLPFSPIRNSELFSNHWLEHRLPLEPEWTELRAVASDALDELAQLWEAQRSRVQKYGSEPTLEEAFIQPVLRALGWKIIYQTHLRGREPDYALFLNDGDLDAALKLKRTDPRFWKDPIALADAKAWHISLDRPHVVQQKREFPPEQIEWYLDKSKLDYAILTNGKLWRLIPREHESGQPRFQTYLECDLSKLLEERSTQSPCLPQVWDGFEDFLRFFLFFSPNALQEHNRRPTLIKRARQGSNEYRLGVGDDLKPRVYDALRLSIDGFLSLPDNKLSAANDIELCRQNSFVLLYRILFILFAEDRKLLPYRVNRLYTDNRSLGRFRDDIATRLDRIQHGKQEDFSANGLDLWNDLKALFDLIDSGATRYQVPGYNGGLFDDSQHPFLARKALPDRYLARVIDQLGRAVDRKRPELGLFRVDYRDLAIQHLGNIYEGLLELRPHFADCDKIVIRKHSGKRSEEKVINASHRVPTGWTYAGNSYAKDSIYLLTDKGERRASGSYYTPNNIVDYIVENALGPLCNEIDRCLAKEIEAVELKLRSTRGRNRDSMKQCLEALSADYDDRVLKLRVLDPAMGSGHFLLRACQYLAEQIATNPNSHDPAASALTGDEPILTFWKRRVAERCLYGVDKNPLAVELAKVALWLETVAIDQPLTFLDHHLRHGDSLLGARVDELGSLPDASELWTSVYEHQVKGRLPALLGAIELIQKMPSDTVPQVKQKDTLFRKTLDPVRDPLRRTAHVWISTLFLEADRRVTPDQYKELLDQLSQPKKFDKVVIAEPYKTAIESCDERGLSAFHWELEFPEAFFSETGGHSNPGFDAVIGNPPYDVLSAKELGRDISDFQRFLRGRSCYAPSFKGKNNLYKLFICRALDLLADGGRLGFITPMTLLGDLQASGIRDAIFEMGAFTAIEAFPQKDDPAKRVFPEAKLSTSVFILVKTSDEQLQRRPFAVRQHPANRIEDFSPSLALQPDHIKRYDPSNRAIVTCSQADLELATRIMSGDRMGRLGDFCASYQGEVNETNERSKATISYDPSDGDEVIRGAHVCLYAIRPASQGTPVYVRRDPFLRDKRDQSKAFDHRYARVGFQRKSPQNNFRRLIGCLIAPHTFILESISYVPAPKSKLALNVVLAILNSKLADWYFRLGSTNAMVSEYQFNNLPCPIFANSRTALDTRLYDKALASIKAGNLSDVFGALRPPLSKAPFSPAIRDVLIELVRRIIAIEVQRGDISRTERSALASAAQPFQDLIDRLLYTMAGLTDDEATGLEQRLARML